MSGAACPVPLVPWATPGAVTPALVVLAGPVKPPGPTRVIHGPEICLRPDGNGKVHLEAPDAAVDMHTPPDDLRRWATVLLSRGPAHGWRAGGCRGPRLPGLRAPYAGRWSADRWMAPGHRRVVRGGDPQRRDAGSAPGRTHMHRTGERRADRRACAV